MSWGDLDKGALDRWITRGPPEPDFENDVEEYCTTCEKVQPGVLQGSYGILAFTCDVCEETVERDAPTDDDDDYDEDEYDDDRRPGDDGET